MRINFLLIPVFVMLSLVLLPAQDVNIGWLRELTDEIANETDLCERCDKLSPNLSIVTFNGQQSIFLRYGCTPLLRRTLKYSMQGDLLGMCEEDSEGSSCGLTSIATEFTLTNDVVQIWSCESGFACGFSAAQNIDKSIPINIDNTKCGEGKKRLWVSEDYNQYNWSSDQGDQSSSSELEISIPGDYSVTATDMNGCETYGSITIEEIEKVDFKIKGKDVLCSGGTTELFATGFESYSWSDGTSGNSMQATETGEYKVTVTNSSGCTGEASFQLGSNEALGIQIVAAPDDIFEGASTQLSIDEGVSTSMIQKWAWSGEGLFDCTECPSPSFRPTSSGEIVLLITDTNGCEETSRYNLVLKELPLEVYTPNVIMPGIDTANETFTIYGGSNIDRVESLSIYDRWGSKVFSQSNFIPNDPAFGWNGILKSNEEASNQYVFTSKVRFTNGREKVFKGVFIVLK